MKGAYKKQKLVLIILIVLSLVGCQSKFIYEVEKLDKSIIIHQDSLKIQIEVVDESIIHVKKSLKGESKSEIPNYVTVLEPQDVEWEFSQNKDQLTVSTEKVKVNFYSDGRIEYFDKEDKSLLAETNDLTYIEPENEVHTVSQGFLAEDEALYGLGQFQSGIMNWKNIPVRLQQDNLEIAIPFVVSTNKYGVYWHNASITDFNASQNEMEFLTVVDKEKKIRETDFTPSKTGMYTFMQEQNIGNKRIRSTDIRVIINGDTIINYDTFWGPTCYSGKKYLEAGKTYKVKSQNTASVKEMGRLFYNEPDFDKTVFSSTVGNTIDYYFVHGETPTEVIAGYQNLTGKPAMFEKKSYGFWQCRERYHNQDEILENAREYRKRGIPVDNIVQDWFYWPEGQKGPEWDRAKYPDPKAMFDELDSLDLNVMVSVWPEVQNEAVLKKYDLHDKKFKNNDNLDFFDPNVRERFYRMLSDSMFHVGASHIWLDGTEPVRKPSLNDTTAAGPVNALYNMYSLMVAKAMYEGKRKEFPNRRVFNLTRSSYSGQQRYGTASWSGDIAGTWEQLSEQITAGLNFTMTGTPYWTHDIGGFFRDEPSYNSAYDDQYTNPEYIELLTRWFQYGSFNPIFRIHGYKSKTEIWRYGKEFEDIARKFIDLRYQLMPYIYSEAWKVTNDSHLLMSPVVYYYPEDKNTWGMKDQFFFGESIMVCTITEYQQRSKEIYLPEGEWFNFWANEKLVGGKKISVNTPIEETPLFVKAGSIIPYGPKVQYATQETEEPLTIKVYPGKDAKYTLYLDDNESYDYESGEYSELLITYTETSKEVSISKGRGDFINFNETPKDFIVEVIGVVKKEKITYSGKKIILNF